MIYLILDTCTWLNLLDDSNKRDNPIDSIELWVENENIKLLAPEILLKEWENNLARNTDRLKKEWDGFEEKAIALFGKDYVKEKINSDVIDYFIDKQLKRAEALLKNCSTKIPISDIQRIEATHLAFEKKRPFHKDKSSMADALIFLSMRDYIRNYSLKECYFITDNYDDFSVSKQDKHNIHPDFAQTFSDLGITYCYKLEWIINIARI
ncbi:MAG TPA: PIN domain-containing protein [Cytophagaceae bacterium]|jgi:hypothetical protein|nr:PIN domain-containing protein [Cytophagaceae bacterium]